MIDLRDSEGYHHRIDEVPSVGREVRIRTTDGRTIDAMVIDGARHNDGFTGMGCEVAYRAFDGEVIPACDMERWRFG